MLLGSVHWIGAWGFDILEDPVVDGRVGQPRASRRVWDGYTEALEELAASGVCDVLAHPDLPKVSGRRPPCPTSGTTAWPRRRRRAAWPRRCRLRAGASRSPRPIPRPPLLARFHKRDVPVTTASDAHELPDVAARAADLRVLLADAGYESLAGYRDRRRAPSSARS